MSDGNGARVPWIDHSKGICIVAIVCLLASRYVQGLAQTDGWVQYWVDFAHPFRTDAFFLIAGLFLSRTIDRSWRTYLDKKVVHYWYFFALWTTLYFLAAILNGEFADGQPLWLHYFSWFVHPFGPLWFVEMLPIFLLLTRLLRRIPWVVVLPLAALLQIWSPESEYRQIERFCERYVFFYAGYVFAPVVFALARKAASSPLLALVGVIIWASVNEWMVLTGRDLQPVYSLALGFVGSAAVVVVASLLSGVRWMDWLRYIGENSLIVFLAFYPFTVLFGRLIWRTGFITDVGWQTVAVTVLSVIFPILVCWTVRRTPLRFIFERPHWASIREKASPAAQAKARPSA